MPSNEQPDARSTGTLNVWVFAALSLQLVMVGAGCGTTSMYTYETADGDSIDAVCEEGIGSEGARWLESSCGVKLMDYTGQAACEAGNGFGCGLAASLAGSNEGLSQSLRKGGSSSAASDRTYDLASRGCSLGNQLSCLIEFSTLAQSGTRSGIQRAIRLGDRKCSEEMPIICQSMGAAFENGARTAADRRKTVEYYRTACDAEFPPGCRKLGKMHAEGFGVTANQTRADKFYGQACELGDKKACDKIGEELPDSSGGTDEEMFVESMNVSNKDMFEMAKAGCKNGFPPACTYFGRVVERGEVRGRYVGIDQAVELYKLGCDKGASRSCFRLANHVARTDRSIEGTDSALSYAKQACNQSVDGACDLRRDLQARQITQANLFESYATRCENGSSATDAKGAASSDKQSGDRASSDGTSSQTSGDESSGKPPSDDTKSDGLDRFGACQIAAIGYANGQVVDKDLKRAVGLYQKGCELGHATACWRAGQMLQTKDDLSASADDINALYKQGCDGGAMAACDELGRRLAGDLAIGAVMTAGLESSSDASQDAEASSDDDDDKGDGADDSEEGSSQDVERAMSYLNTACNARYGKACATLATILKNQGALQNALNSIAGVEGVKVSAQDDDGSQVDPDARRESLLQRGCATGYVPACRRLGIFYMDRANSAEDYTQAFKMLHIGCRQDDAEACAHLGINEVEFDDAEFRAEGQKHLEQACIGGSGLGCRGLGDGYYNGSFVEKDREKSAELYTQACTNGSGAGCAMLARQYEAGEGVDYNPEQARNKYKQACNKGHGDGCLGLAKMYLYGSATDYNLDKGETYLQEGCNMGHDDSCFQLEQLHTSGTHQDVSLSAAREALQAGCLANSMTACDRVANYYYLGIGTDKDSETGDEYATKVGDKVKTGCETYGSESACVRWAHHLAHGKGTETDAPRARNLLDKKCEENDGGQSCIEIADLKARGHIYEHNRVAAMENLRSWCDEDNVGACNLEAYYRLFGRDVDLAPEKAMSHYRSECDGDDSTACEMLARGYLTGFGARREPRRAVRLLEPMCRPGNESGCIAYTSGLIGMGASDRATERLKESEAGCDNRHAPHCVVAGKLTATGLGTERNLETAAKRFERACKEGMVFACPSADLLNTYIAAAGANQASGAAGRCEGGEMKACLVAGVDAQYGIQTERAPEEAADLFNTACENGTSLGCAARISMHRFQEVNLAGDDYFEYAQKSCKARSPDFCYALAHRTVPFEWKPAVDMASRACERGEKRACLWLIDRGVSPPESTK
jgi:TPR repeat protein